MADVTLIEVIREELARKQADLKKLEGEILHLEEQLDLNLLREEEEEEMTDYDMWEEEEEEWTKEEGEEFLKRLSEFKRNQHK